MSPRRSEKAEVGDDPRDALLGDIRQLIDASRSAVAAAINAGLTMLYWRIGKRINEVVLRGERAEYGAEIVSTLSRQLVLEYGNGFSAKSLRHMIRFAEAEYLTDLPPKALLERKLHQAIRNARRQIENRSGSEESG